MGTHDAGALIFFQTHHHIRRRFRSLGHFILALAHRPGRNNPCRLKTQNSPHRKYKTVSSKGKEKVLAYFWNQRNF